MRQALPLAFAQEPTIRMLYAMRMDEVEWRGDRNKDMEGTKCEISLLFIFIPLVAESTYSLEM